MSLERVVLLFCAHCMILRIQVCTGIQVEPGEHVRAFWCVCLTRYMEENVGTSTQKEKINMSDNIVNSLERQTCLLPWRAYILMKSWFSFELSQDLNPLTPYL